jgi:predicted membrane protein
LAGIIVFGISRPFQFVWIIGSLAFNWEELILWQALLQITFTVFFTTLQMYSLTIHLKLYKRCGEMQKASGNQVNEVWRFEEESVVDVFEVSEVFKSSHNDVWN